MLNAESIKDAEQRRLAWRCRRGMLEIDIVLQKFVTTYFNELTLTELESFDELLAMTDKDLWNVLSMKNLHLKSKLQQSIVDKLQHLQTVE
jgi:antitoxin CptB|tara:strand:- start:13298 stop:13570 length:273 start_codon:yes stop_codon:yes gene_type:complete